MSFYKKITGEDYLNLFDNLEIMSMPSTHEDINAVEDEQTDEVDINAGMEDSKQSCKQDDFLSFFDLNNNINKYDELEELEDDISETDSFNEHLVISDDDDDESK